MPLSPARSMLSGVLILLLGSGGAAAASRPAAAATATAAAAAAAAAGPSAAAGVPADRLPPDRFRDVQWRDPRGWSMIYVSRHGLAPDQPGVDAASAVARIVAETSGRRILYFPPGSYYFRSTLNVTTGDLILRGAGPARTRFVIDGPRDPNAEIRFTGGVKATATATAVLGSPAAGATFITVADGSRFRAGDSLQLYRAGGRVAYDNPTEMQLLRVRAVSGDRLELDMKLGLSYPADERPRVRSIVPLRNVGVEQLKVQRLREPTKEKVDNIAMWAVDNAFVRDIESDRAGRHHVSLSFARDAVVERTHLHGGFRNRGGHLYGAGASWSTRVRMTDNKAYDLRHFFVLQLGTNHSIVSYNSAEPPYRDYNDMALHANYAYMNLFEGNTFHEGYADNSKDGSMSATGPGNVWFRNQAVGKIGSINEATRRQVMIGNLVGSLRLLGDSHFVGANRVAGQDRWGHLETGTALPASLYLTAEPGFFGDRPWPVYGPDVPGWGAGNAPPARGRAKRSAV